MKKILATLVGFLVINSVNSWAADPVIDPFTQQRDLIDSLIPYAERSDVPRLLAIRSTIDATLQEIQGNRGAGRRDVTFPTLTRIQGLVIQYGFSKVFFGWTNPPALTSIYTEETAATLAKLKTQSDQLVTDYGFDQTMFTQITANTFKQMQKLLLSAEDVTLATNLKSQLRSLWPAVGKVIAAAEQGDRPKAFELSKPLAKTIRSLYPFFDQISSSDAGFSIVMELQGLNEFYVEFAQMDQ